MILTLKEKIFLRQMKVLSTELIVSYNNKYANFNSNGWFRN